jgi:hypothetical protein
MLMWTVELGFLPDGWVAVQLSFVQMHLAFFMKGFVPLPPLELPPLPDPQVLLLSWSLLAEVPSSAFPSVLPAGAANLDFFDSSDLFESFSHT